MSEAPFFSIVIPTYNRCVLLKRAISSVQYQTYTNWELLIIDDGSEDITRAMVLGIKDTRISYYFQKNQGRSIARNKGIGLAKGDFICFLDSDDYYLENHLESLEIKIRQQEQADGLYYTGALVESNGVMIEVPRKSEHKLGIEYLMENSLMINSVCLPKKILSLYRFPTYCDTWEDTNLWMRILSRFPLIIVERYTTVVCQHEERGYIDFINTDSKATFLKHINCIKELFISDLDLMITERDKNKYLFRQYTKIIFQLWSKNKYWLSYQLITDAVSSLFMTKYIFKCLKLYILTTLRLITSTLKM